MNQQKALKLFTVLSKTYRAIHEADQKDVLRCGLNLTEFAALEMLFHKGAQPIQKIAEKVLLTSGSMTYVVGQLEKKEFVRRTVCETDKRVTYIELTENGEALMAESFPLHAKFIGQLFDVLTEEEGDALTVTLKKLGKSIEAKNK